MEDKTNLVDASEGEPKITKTKHRSPNFPSINLQKALDWAKKIDAVYKRAEVPIHSVHEKMGFTRNSGIAYQITAALKAYGLIDINGNGDKRTIKLTDRAQKILGGHPDHNKFIKESALSPTIYREILEKYQGELPTDEALKIYLQWDLKFNPKSIEGFIADFSNTITFAKIVSTDIIGNGGKDKDTSADPGVGDDKPPIDTGAQNQPPKGAALLQDRCGMATDNFTLDEGPVVLQYPKVLSQSSFEDFKTWMELQLRKIQRSIKENVSPAEEPKE